MSKSLLAIKSSLRGAESVSNRLVDLFLGEWRAHRPQDQIFVRDLAAQPLPHLDGEAFAAFATPPDRRTERQSELAARSDALIDELLSVDLIVLGVPMYNKSAPSTFKAYIDNIARAGRTFRYTAQGSVGLLASKKACVLTTRGGFYQGTARDVETPWLVEILQLIGISDVDFVFAEGLNVSPEQHARAVSAAEAEIRALVGSAV